VCDCYIDSSLRIEKKKAAILKANKSVHFTHLD